MHGIGHMALFPNQSAVSQLLVMLFLKFGGDSQGRHPMSCLMKESHEDILQISDNLSTSITQDLGKMFYMCHEILCLM